MYLVKSISLDLIKILADNRIMNEKPKSDQTQEIINEWSQGEKFEEEGYGDLGFTLKQNAINKAMKLATDARKIIADILFPEK